MFVIDPAFVRAEVDRLAGTSTPVAPLNEAREIVDGIDVTGELHRLITIREAELIAYQEVMHEEAAFVTGANIAINGASTCSSGVAS